jgi:hypothetical protein
VLASRPKARGSALAVLVPSLSCSFSNLITKRERSRYPSAPPSFFGLRGLYRSGFGHPPGGRGVRIARLTASGQSPSTFTRSGSGPLRRRSPSSSGSGIFVLLLQTFSVFVIPPFSLFKHFTKCWHLVFLVERDYSDFSAPKYVANMLVRKAVVIRVGRIVPEYDCFATKNCFVSICYYFGVRMLRPVRNSKCLHDFNPNITRAFNRARQNHCASAGNRLGIYSVRENETAQLRLNQRILNRCIKGSPATGSVLVRTPHAAGLASASDDGH